MNQPFTINGYLNFSQQTTKLLYLENIPAKYT